MTLDLGACTSVLPTELLCRHEVKQDAQGWSYCTASGEEVSNEGFIKLPVLTYRSTEDRGEANVNFRVTEPSVQKPLGSAYQSCLTGNRIVLDLDTGSYITNKKAKKILGCIHKTAPLRLTCGSNLRRLWRLAKMAQSVSNRGKEAFSQGRPGEGG